MPDLGAARDVVDFRPAAAYDLILSVSTLEHIGWDEPELAPDKVRTAFAHLTDILAPGGRLWATIPCGYHRYLDRYIEDGDMQFTDLHFLRRRSPRGWREVSREEAQGLPYGVGYQGAVALAVGTFDKP
jgi:hypothetical protein